MQGNARKNVVSSAGLTGTQEKAVCLYLEHQKTDEQIAQELGINPTTLWRWQKLPAFQQRLTELREELRDRMGNGTVADQLWRLRKADVLQKQRLAIIEKRADYFTRHPTGEDMDIELSSGLYRKKITRHTSPDGSVTETIEAVYDHELDSAVQSTMLYAAREMGDLTIKNEVSGPRGEPIPVQAEVKVVGFAWGGIDDVVTTLLELQKVGRLPTNKRECEVLIVELEARAKAEHEGHPVPPMLEPYRESSR